MIKSYLFLLNKRTPIYIVKPSNIGHPKKVRMLNPTTAESEKLLRAPLYISSRLFLVTTLFKSKVITQPIDQKIINLTKNGIN